MPQGGLETNFLTNKKVFIHKCDDHAYLRAVSSGSFSKKQ